MPSPQTDRLLQSAQQHHQAGRPRKAEAIYHQILAAEPNHPRAQFMLGVLAHQRKDIPAAVDWLVKSAIADPNFAESHFFLGVILHQRGDLAAATEAYQRAIALEPNHIKALNNLGRALLDQDQLPRGLQLLQKVVALAPQHASAHSNLGDALRLSKQFDAAIAEYDRAIALQPNFAEAHGNRGAALAEQGKLTPGIASLQKALAINPRLATGHYNLGKALQEQNKFDDAIRHCKIFLELRPDYADGHNLLGSLIGISGDMPQAIIHQKRAIELRPHHPGNASNLLLSLHYLDDPNPAAIFQAHLDWAARHANPFLQTNQSHTNDKSSDRRLRIGYVSPNFLQHSVACFLESVFASHDRSKVEIVCYADLPHSDVVTKRFEKLADHWRDITDDSAAAVAQKIRDDSIDILVDLAGHTADNRMVVFAMKPAPLQITWLGYPDTTGLKTIDYRLTDEIADPLGFADTLNTEKLIRIPGGAWAYTPPASSPSLASPPSLKNNFITFGSFNNLPKVTPRVLQTWAKILASVPNSRLLLKAMGLTAQPGRDYVRRHLASIDPKRIELLGWSPTTSSHLELYNRIDIALDTFPYNGTTTTVEALWMGVPVITFPGQTHAARVSTSLLTHAGFPQLIAQGLDGYINLAAKIANDLNQLIDLRKNLRTTLANSPLCDGQRMARQLESIYRTAWIHAGL